jgi:hypothetical protein
MVEKMNKVSANRNKIIKLLKSTRRFHIDSLINWLMETDFFKAPASTRQDYHAAHEGGLAEHSLNVYKAFEAKAKQYKIDIKPSQRIISSLCHDFCKINIYKENELKNGDVSDSKPYVVEDDFPLGHGEKSIYLASYHVQLVPNEALLIRWHMGGFDPQWENYEHKVAEACPAIYAFQAADLEASKYMDKRKK